MSLQTKEPHVFYLRGQALLHENLEFRCAVGRGGIGTKEKEGDCITPVGRFNFRLGFYREDRLKKPASFFPLFPLEPNLGWCDDPADSNYNRLICLPYQASHEELWRNDHVYDIILVLGHNDNPVIPHKGSAIFMHIARENYSPTAGCVALKQEDLLRVCEKLTSHSILDIDH
jgi:L,D-peptidoglycan transpeptidase YkuD (ErfK/YbiS/YcfS/YnhG family)